MTSRDGIDGARRVTECARGLSGTAGLTGLRTRVLQVVLLWKRCRGLRVNGPDVLRGFGVKVTLKPI